MTGRAAGNLEPRRLHGGLLTLAVALVLGVSGALAETPPLPAGVFALVNGEEISDADFAAYFERYVRKKHYHGASAEQVEAARGEAVEQMVIERLLDHEARRRGLVGDREAVEKRIAALEERYKGTETWQESKKQIPAIRAQLLAESRMRKLEEEVRQVTDADSTALGRFYEENPALFTEPRQTEISVILFRVDPGASSDIWDQAQEKAKGIHEELLAGGDFADYARRHSDHHSAASGGGLGLLHDGQLSAAAQEAVDQLGEGEITGPVKVLEGYVLLKVGERQEARVREFEVVQDRAMALYKREKSEAQWEAFLADLRNGASVTVRGTGDGVEQPQQGTGN